jgi:osmotically-inducible protein OsmY
VLHRSDDDIRGDLERMLSDPLWAPDGLDVQITVASGVVTLTGTTRFPLDLPVVTSLTWRVAGVVDVRNEAAGREPDPRVVPA